MLFVVTAMDCQDDDAINRRLGAREEHLAGVKAAVLAGNFKSGGAILNDEGKMIGSSIHMEFETREQLDEFLKNDPYSRDNVWDTIDIQEIRLVPVIDMLKEAGKL